MAKKRNCRQTIEEAEIHKQAVKLRKMTDRQLVEAFEKVNKTVEMSLTWEDIYEAADGKAFGSEELTAKDEARYQVVCLIEDITGKNIENGKNAVECVEDEIGKYCILWNIRFNDRGNIVNHTAENSSLGKLERLLEELSQGNCKGIKSATAAKIMIFCEELGLI